MQATGSSAFVERMIGAARLDEATYEAVEADESATPSALIVVVLAAVAGGIGSLRDNGGTGFIGGIIAGVIGWAAFSLIAYWVGTRLLAGPQTSATAGQVLRTLGFAYAPLILGVVGFIPVVGWIVVLVAAIWFLAAAIVALRHALDVSTGRAIAVALVSFIPYLVVVGIVGAIFGIEASMD